MRSLRVGIAALIGVAVFSVPSAASAQVTDVSVTAVQLGPEGATVDVPVTVVCDVGYGIVGVSVTVAQSTGHKLATAGGTSFSVLCDSMHRRSPGHHGVVTELLLVPLGV